MPLEQVSRLDEIRPTPGNKLTTKTKVRMHRRNINIAVTNKNSGVFVMGKILTELNGDRCSQVFVEINLCFGNKSQLIMVIFSFWRKILEIVNVLKGNETRKINL